MSICQHNSPGYIAVTDDVVQTRHRDTINLTTGAGSVIIRPPTGQFWIIDRVTVQTDTGVTGVVTLYDGDADPTNAISGGVAQAGLGIIVGSFDPPIEVGQEGLRIGISGVVGLSSVAVGVWYRRRFRVASTPKADMFFPVVPNDTPASVDGTITSEAPVWEVPPIAMVDTEDRLPLDDEPAPDVTYR